MTALGRKYEHGTPVNPIATAVRVSPAAVVMWGIVAAVAWQLVAHFPFSVALGVSLAVVGAVWR